MLTNQLEPIFPRSLKDLQLTYESSCLSELELMLSRIAWNEGNEDRVIQK